MARSLSRMLGSGEQSGDGTTGDQLRRAASRGMREAVKGVVKEAIEDADLESRRSRGSSRGMVTLGLGAIAGYLVRDWQLRPETYEGIEEEIGAEFSEMSQGVSEAREEHTEDESRSWTSRLGRLAGIALLVGVGYAMLKQRRGSQRTEQWTEERGQEQGGLAGEPGGEMGDAGRMTGESSGMGGETAGMGDETSDMAGEEGQGSQQTTTGGTSSESMSGSSEDEESNE